MERLTPQSNTEGQRLLDPRVSKGLIKGIVETPHEIDVASIRRIRAAVNTPDDVFNGLMGRSNEQPTAPIAATNPLLEH